MPTWLEYEFMRNALLAAFLIAPLFALLGINYGGNGQTTFALPDLRGRIPINQGTGPGLSTHSIGQAGGTETTTLVLTQMPAHSHTITYY